MEQRVEPAQEAGTHLTAAGLPAAPVGTSNRWVGRGVGGWVS